MREAGVEGAGQDTKGKDCEMKNYFVCFILFLSGMFCACNHPEETAERLTAEPVVTEKIVQEETKIPIEEAYFGNSDFCKLIRLKYDADGDGFLSDSEREAVKVVSWEGELEASAVETDGDSRELRGFEYFPNLESISIAKANQVTIRNHPSLKRYGSGEGYIAQTVIESCPELEYIGYSMSGGSLSVKNCRKLRRFWAHECYDGLGTLEFIDTPELHMLFYLSEPEQITADAAASVLFDAGIASEDIKSERKTEDSISQEFGAMTVRWLGVGERNILLTEDFPLAYLDEEDFSWITVLIFDRAEDSYDEAGNKGYNICIEFEDIHSRAAFPLYTPVPPEEENFIVRPVRVGKLELLEYSPDQNASFKVSWDLEVLYRNGEQETVIGCITDKEQYVCLKVEDKAEFYPSREKWEQASADRRFWQ